MPVEHDEQASAPQFPDWRQRLVRSLHVSRSKPEAKYFQLATVNEKGRPENRTVVFRGFADTSNVFYVVTDKRSAKFQHLINNPFAEVCWYFAKTREQYRLACDVELYTSTSDSDVLPSYISMWKKLSNAAQQPFFGPSPGIPIDEDTNNDSEQAKSLIPESFVVLAMTPLEVDYLDLKQKPHLRITSTAEAGWKVNQVVA